MKTRGLELCLLVGLGLISAGCSDEPSHEYDCNDGLDNDGDDRVDCDDSDCIGTADCQGAQCGDGVAEMGEACDDQDLSGQTCLSLGHEGGVLGCTSSCRFDRSLCTGDPICGDDHGEGTEACDGDDLREQSCESVGFVQGSLSCREDCTFNTDQCEFPLLQTCQDEGGTSNGVTGELTCFTDVGTFLWDGYSVNVQAGDCVDIQVDNGAGSADLLAFAVDAEGVATFGWMEDYSQLDDEMECSNLPWDGFGCPSRALTAETSGAFRIYVAQWDGEGTQSGVDTCSAGYSEYTLHVAVNGVDATPLLEENDVPL